MIVKQFYSNKDVKKNNKVKWKPPPKKNTGQPITFEFQRNTKSLGTYLY